MSSKDETKQDNITQNPEVLAAIKRFFVDNKSSIPYKHAYCTKEYGQRAKEIIDWVIEHKKPYKIPLPPDYTIHALRQQWYEGTRYLRTKMDPEHKYIQLLAFIRCRTEFDYIEIVPRPALKGLLIKASEDSDKAVNTEWRQELTNWIDSSPEEHTKFERTDVVLADSDIGWCHQQLIGVEKLFYGEFTHNKILVVRYTHE